MCLVTGEPSPRPSRSLAPLTAQLLCMTLAWRAIITKHTKRGNLAKKNDVCLDIALKWPKSPLYRPPQNFWKGAEPPPPLWTTLEALYKWGQSKTCWSREASPSLAIWCRNQPGPGHKFTHHCAKNPTASSNFLANHSSARRPGNVGGTETISGGGYGWLGTWGEEGELTASKVQSIHTGWYWSLPKFLVAYPM